jgi:phage portal protein BeeE
MGSLLGMLLAPRNQAGGSPVPMGSGGSMIPGVAPGGNTDLTLIRAYNGNGTNHANVSLIASSVASQDWHLYRSATQGSRYTTADKGSDQRKQVAQHAALNVLESPASINVNGVTWPVWDRMGLFEISQIWLEQTGKSYWIVDNFEGKSKVPLGLWPVRPDRLQPVPDRDKYLAGWIYTAPDGRERIPLLPTEVIFNSYPDPEDTYGGSGPIRSVLTDIQAASMAAEWNRNFFSNSAEPGGVIQLDGKLEDEEFNELVDRWRDSHRGVARAHRIAVLENGATWIPNQHSMRDMDFANLRGTSRDIIREAVGVGKTMTGVSDDVNRANAQTSQEVFASWTVDPRLRRWRNVLNTQFLRLFGATATGNEWDYVYPMPQNREEDALELTTKTNAVLALVTAGYDPADALEVVGLPPMKVAEKATQQPALPPSWVAPPPAGPPPGEGGGGDGATAGVPVDAMREAAGWTSAAWSRAAALDNDLRRRMAAWNGVAA